MKSDRIQSLVEGYAKMADRVHGAVYTGTEQARQTLEGAVETAVTEAVRLDELSHEEADKVSKWLKRDLHSIADYANKTGREFKDWMPFEIKAEEDFLWGQLMSVADQTTLELLELKGTAELSEFDLWQTGEVTGAGALECTQCGEQIHFRQAGHIPPCPKCHNSKWQRLAVSE